MTVHSSSRFPGEPVLASFIAAKDDGGGGDNWSCKTCKAPIKSSPPTNTQLFIQAGCSSCRPANNVKALKENQNCSIQQPVAYHSYKLYVHSHRLTW